MKKIIKKKTFLITICVLSILGPVSLYNMGFIKSAFAFAGDGSKGIVNESELAETYGGACGLCVWVDAFCNTIEGNLGCESSGGWCDDEDTRCEDSECNEMGTECQTEWPTYECGDVYEVCSDTWVEKKCETWYHLVDERMYCWCKEYLSISCSEHTSEGKTYCDHD